MSILHTDVGLGSGQSGAGGWGLQPVAEHGQRGCSAQHLLPTQHSLPGPLTDSTGTEREEERSTDGHHCELSSVNTECVCVCVRRVGK